MYRRVVYTVIGALAGYLIGAIVGMMAFASVNGYRSVAIVEEPNRNRWTFAAAATAAVAGGLIAWWRSYSPAAVAPETSSDAADDGEERDAVADVAEPRDPDGATGHELPNETDVTGPAGDGAEVTADRTGDPSS
jgi:hypothetical protein